MNENIKQQYEILSELTIEDEKIVRLNTELNRIPDEISKLEQILSTKKEAFQKTKNTLETQEKNLRSLELDLKEREEYIHRAEGKMMEVKTNDEYRAAVKENDGMKKTKGILEEGVLSLMNEVEAQKKQFKETETTFKEFQASYDRDRQQLEAALKLVQDEIAKHNAVREQVAKRLSPDISDMYLKIVAKTKGVAVAPVENSLCLGCHVRVRPQLYNEILGFVAIHRCPSCGRILILPQSRSNGDAASVAESQK